MDLAFKITAFVQHKPDALTRRSNVSTGLVRLTVQIPLIHKPQILLMLVQLLIPTDVKMVSARKQLLVVLILLLMLTVLAPLHSNALLGLVLSQAPNVLLCILVILALSNVQMVAAEKIGLSIQSYLLVL